MTRDAAEWDASYNRDEAPPWDIGRPQPVFADLADRGLLRGRLFDAGCGSGEHTLLAASCGAEAAGIDLSVTAVTAARRKAGERGLAARFAVGDLLAAPLRDGQFDTIIDSGVFHSFTDEQRPVYVGTLARLARPDARVYVVCFSEHQPGDWGPRRVRQDELRAAFADGWSVESIEAAPFTVQGIPDVSEVKAWLTTLRRT